MPKTPKVVTITLSNPLTAKAAARIGLEDRDYEVEEDIKVDPTLASAIISAGYATIDPEDREAVLQAVYPQAAATATEPVTTKPEPGESDTGNENPVGANMLMTDTPAVSTPPEADGDTDGAGEATPPADSPAKKAPAKAAAKK